MKPEVSLGMPSELLSQPSGNFTLKADYPFLVRQWHRERNGMSAPDDLSAHTHRRVWWICEKGHEWRASVGDRVRGTGCPVCTNRRVLIGENDLATTHPHLALEWLLERNQPLTPQSVVAGNHSKVWWRCERGHEWQATVFSRSSGTGCPVCAGKRVVAGENDLAAAFPQIAAEWHPTKNAPLLPNALTPYSNRRVFWCCPVGHTYRAAVSHRTQERSGCPYCGGRKVLEGFNDLATKEPQIAAQWYAPLNGSLTPQSVTVACHKKVWWQCGEGHVWKAVIASRTGAKRSGCPICAGRVKQTERYAALLDGDGREGTT